MSYQFQDRAGSGDLEMTVDARTLPTFFKDAARGLANAMVESGSIHDKNSHVIKVQAKSVERLLYSWLEELIVLKDAKSFLWNTVIVKITEAENLWTLTATVTGDKINGIRHSLRYDVKAVTLHDFVVEKRAAGWHAHVLFDL